MAKKKPEAGKQPNRDRVARARARGGRSAARIRRERGAQHSGFTPYLAAKP